MRGAWERSHGHCGTAKKNFGDKLEAAARSADALIANIGVWYGEAQMAAYRSDVAHVLATLHALRTAGKLGLYREESGGGGRP